ncbi:hypothetical protein JB92DRAFT_3255114 [Gautieria morchelliformis]|nr:hypothetical protein JB92DRAFT_3255114 [Gautieria morchelliformis]
MFPLTTFLSLSLAAAALAFPAHQSLAGLTRDELDYILPGLEDRNPEQPPGPLNNTSVKLVNDEAHPWRPLYEGDIRGVCPSRNTMASHPGYHPHNVIAIPAQIITAVRKYLCADLHGFNMSNDLAIFLRYAAFLAEGNPITTLMSIGGKAHSTGPNPPALAIVSDLTRTQASKVRCLYDAFFGDSFSFNETLFQEFSNFSQRFGGRKYNFTGGRVQVPAYTGSDRNQLQLFVRFTALLYCICRVLPTDFLRRVSDMQLDMTAARSFFQNSHYPDGFFRANRSISLRDVTVDPIFAAHPLEPGANHGVGNCMSPILSRSS